ncbi:MAG: hypothetical protein ACFCUM_02050, partial [Bacteroidales bacterium]
MICIKIAHWLISGSECLWGIFTNEYVCILRGKYMNPHASLFFLLLLSTIISSGCSQAEGPNSDSYTESQIEEDFLITNLELLGKIWGFLKYHHPEVGKGKY